MSKYGIVEEIPEGIIWFEPVTDTSDQYVLRTNDEIGEILYFNKRLDCIEAFIEGLRYERPALKGKSAAQIWAEAEERCEQRTLDYLDKLIAEKNSQNT